MRMRTSWLAGLLLALAMSMPGTARAQGPNFNGPAVELPLPTMWGDRDAGPYVAGELLFMRLNQPLRRQALAFRGLWDIDGSLDGSTTPDNPLVRVEDNTGAFINNFFLLKGQAGAFLGTGDVALTAKAGGAERFEPGFRLTIGYRFQDGIAVEAVYWRLADFKYSGGASLMPPPGRGVRQDFADSFISFPFFNFSPFFGGAERDVVGNVLPFPDPGTRPIVVPDDVSGIDPVTLAELQTYHGLPLPAYGIWNAAEDATVTFDQEIWSLELNARFPLCQTECTRTYVICGARYLELTEHFLLRVSDADIDGFIAPENVAIYDNHWENRLYGLQAGMGNEAYLGGGFALSVEARTGVFANYQRTEVTLSRGDDDGNKSNRDAMTVSPMFSAAAYLWWYPVEGVQLRAGYEFLGVFGVHRSERPVDFNVGQLDPEYKDLFLKMDGFTLGVAFIF